MQKWIYVGPHSDPHVRAWVPGMSPLVEHVVTDEIAAACIPPASVPAGEVRITELPDLTEGGATAYAFREAWKTQLSPEPVASLLVTRLKFDTPAEALKAAANAFPQVWPRFGKLTIGETCKFERKSSAASVNTTPTPAPASPPASASDKSSV